jgi:hypothetical protein
VLTWDSFKRELTAVYDSPLRVETLRNDLRGLQFKGSLNKYVEAFRRIESQIPDDAMLFADRLSYFLSHLPSELARDIRREKPTDTIALYHSARELNRLNLTDSRPNPSSGGKKKDFFKQKRHNNPHPPVAQPNALFTTPSTYGEPMDLDALTQFRPPRRTGTDKSQVRCFNCNRRGHYAKECRSPKAPHTNHDLHVFETLTASMNLNREHTQAVDPAAQVVDPSDMNVLTLEDDDAPLERLPTYPIYLAPSDRNIATYAGPFEGLVDTGAGPSYVRSDVPRMLGIIPYGMAPRQVVGAGRTTTRSFIYMRIKIGSFIRPLSAFVLDPTCRIRAHLIIGRNFMKRHDAKPDWTDNAWLLTDPSTLQKVRLRPLATIPSPPIPLNIPHTRPALNALIMPSPVRIEGTQPGTPHPIATMDRYDLIRMPPPQALSDATPPQSNVPSESIEMNVHDGETATSFHADSDSDDSMPALVPVDDDDDDDKDSEPTKPLAAAADAPTFGSRLKATMKSKFPTIFREKVGFPPSRRWDHRIDTGDAQPIKVQGRQLSPAENEAVRKFIEDGLADGTTVTQKT